MILKWLILIALFFLVFWLFKPLRQKNRRSSDVIVSSEVEDMVRCLQCGVHLPKSESITQDGQRFCSTEHYQLYLQSHHKQQEKR
jgi:uncharacterized protein